MKGIILAGGTGTRLYPITKSVSKQLLPIYDKPMIYYPLSVLLLAGIKEILIITTPRDKEAFYNLLGNGEDYGIHLEYAVQEAPKGLVEAFIIGESFIGSDTVCLALGDNIFYGASFGIRVARATQLEKGALILGCYVSDASQYGVIEIDKNGDIVSIEEKPENPKSNLAIPGLYFFDNNVVSMSKKVVPSKRGELEIISLINEYHQLGELKVDETGRGTAWLDTGTHSSLLEASSFVETIQNRQGLYIACIEEIAYKKGYITKEKLKKLAKPLEKTDYGKYILELVND